MTFQVVLAVEGFLAPVTTKLGVTMDGLHVASAIFLEGKLTVALITRIHGHSLLGTTNFFETSREQ